MNQTRTELPSFFENKEEMINFCMKFTHEHAIKCNIYNSGNYYKVQCKNSECPFMITYNLRDSKKCQRGYYLVIKGTNIYHRANCVQSIDNIRQ